MLTDRGDEWKDSGNAWNDGDPGGSDAEIEVMHGAIVVVNGGMVVVLVVLWCPGSRWRCVCRPEPWPRGGGVRGAGRWCRGLLAGTLFHHHHHYYYHINKATTTRRSLGYVTVTSQRVTHVAPPLAPPLLHWVNAKVTTLRINAHTHVSIGPHSTQAAVTAPVTDPPRRRHAH